MKTLCFLIFLAAAAAAQTTQHASLGDHVDKSSSASADRRNETTHSGATEPEERVKSTTQLSRGFRAATRKMMSFDTTAEGTVWVRGQSYKASFGADGMTYIPFLGPCAPRNYPVHSTIEAITAGAEAVEFDSFAPAVRAGTRVTFERGGVSEIYDVSPESVEQSFVFQGLPAAGDLVLNLNVESELAQSERPEGFEFGNERGAVRCSRAVVRDAAGSMLSSSTVIAASGIEIRVPAAEIAHAAFPLTVDPVFSTFAIDTTTQDDFTPDVAYDPATNRYFVCEEETISAVDHDVIAFEIDSNGVVIGNGVCVDCTTAFRQTPKIANNRADSQFLVVAADGIPGSSVRTIVGREILAWDFTMGSWFQVSPDDMSGDKLNPDVGGDFDINSSHKTYCVVWTRIRTSSDFDVHGAVVNTNSMLFSHHTILIDNSIDTADTVPHISKTTGGVGTGGVGNSQSWMVVWNRDKTPGDRDVYGAMIGTAGEITVPSYVIDDGLSDDTYPRVSSSQSPSGLFFVVYQRYIGLANHDVIGALVKPIGFGFQVLDSKDLSTTFESAFHAEDQLHPSVDSDESHFEVAYAEQYVTSATDYDIYVSDYAIANNSIVAGEVHQLVAFSSDAESNPLIAANRIGTGRSMIVWDRQVTSGSRDTEGALYMSTVGGPILNFCFGDGSVTACPCANSGATGHGCANSVHANGALLTTSGNAVYGQFAFYLIGSEQPASATGTFLQGTANLGGVPFGDGLRCAGGTLIRLGTKVASGGVSQYPGSSDTAIWYRGQIPASLGGTRYYQLWYRDPNPTFCTSSTYNMTNAIQVTWTL